MKVVTYIKPKCNNSSVNIDTSNLATKQQLKDGIQEAKDYTDSAIDAINTNGGSSHVHTNMALLNKFKEVDGDLYFGDINLNSFNVVFETVEG